MSLTEHLLSKVGKDDLQGLPNNPSYSSSAGGGVEGREPPRQAHDCPPTSSSKGRTAATSREAPPPTCPAPLQVTDGAATRASISPGCAPLSPGCRWGAISPGGAGTPLCRRRWAQSLQAGCWLVGANSPLEGSRGRQALGANRRGHATLLATSREWVGLAWALPRRFPCPLLAGLWPASCGQKPPPEGEPRRWPPAWSPPVQVSRVLLRPDARDLHRRRPLRTMGEAGPLAEGSGGQEPSGAP